MSQSAYARAQAAEGKPAAVRVVTLQPEAFASSYSRRPLKPVRIGLRPLPPVDFARGRATAARAAAKAIEDAPPCDHNRPDAHEYAVTTAQRHHPNLAYDHPVWIETYNEALKVFVVARGTCRPDDLHAPYFELAEELVPRALTSGGIDFLFAQIELLIVMESAASDLDDEEALPSLAGLLMSGELFEGKSPRRQRRIKRLLIEALRVATDTSPEAE